MCDMIEEMQNLVENVNKVVTKMDKDEPKKQFKIT